MYFYFHTKNMSESTATQQPKQGVANGEVLKSSFSVDFTIKDLFDNLLHYGHKVEFKNSKMAEFIHDEKSGISIIDLVQTKHYLSNALFEAYKLARRNARILFVGTKTSISKSVKKHALNCGQYYVHNRWLGGTLTNWDTISALLRKLDRLEKTVKTESSKYTKKELLKMTKEIQKLERFVGGLRGMKNRPDAIIVVDALHSKMAVKEASDIGIKVFCIVDTNSDPAKIDYVVPANDDSVKSVEFILGAFSKAILQGIKDSISNWKA
jgi:small subunit ribosomal protein S2